ncbi:LpqN/LpqT family lipoprotein [Agreia sp. COWG]|uniref:LpqN/LpqT family lipoprotein n=1 Tax=Agreia sp. COWG TaxID=2773266 RepID=UPI00192570F1|nr:LpqN/LpqT family lipoprotein [Agreia sp. COWG]CAD5992906.1 conserved protein of unknown function [Agreia sp. COWG]
MTTRISFPSADFPAPSALALELPDGWVGQPTSGTVLAAFKPGAPGEFTPNVVVTASRFGEDYELSSAITAVRANVDGIAGVSILGSETVEVAGSPGFRIEFSFDESRAGTLIQAVRVAVIANGNVVDLITVTGTATALQAQTVWGEIRAVQESLTAGE